MAHTNSNEGTSSGRIPIFDGTNYAFWNRRMKAYLMALGVGVWQSHADEYGILDSIPIDLHGRNVYE